MNLLLIVASGTTSRCPESIALHHALGCQVAAAPIMVAIVGLGVIRLGIGGLLRIL